MLWALFHLFPLSLTLLPLHLRFEHGPVEAKFDKPEEKVPQILVLHWENEPATIDALLDAYNIEAKVPGKIPGTTLFLVGGRGRNNKCEQLAEHQMFKLFIVSWINLF